MARKKQEQPEEGAYWMDTYGDMVTLLLTFFVLLFAMSTVNAEKWEMFVKAFQGKADKASQIVVNVADPGDKNADKKVPDQGTGETIGTTEKIEKPTNFDELYLYLQQYVKDNGLESEVQLSKGDGYTFIQFGNNIFFDGNQAAIRPDGQAILDFMSSAFAFIPEQIKEVAIYGHTAQEAKDVPNSLDFDWTLSTNRAKNVGLYLMKKNVLTADKFSCIGYGQYRPIVPHDGTEPNRKQNRRVEFRISEEGAKIIPLEDIYEEVLKGGNPEDLKKQEEEKQKEEEKKKQQEQTSSMPEKDDSKSSDTSSTQTDKKSDEKNKSDDQIVITLPTYNIADIAKKIINNNNS